MPTTTNMGSLHKLMKQHETPAEQPQSRKNKTRNEKILRCRLLSTDPSALGFSATCCHIIYIYTLLRPLLDSSSAPKRRHRERHVLQNAKIAKENNNRRNVQPPALKPIRMTRKITAKCCRKKQKGTAKLATRSSDKIQPHA